MTPMLNYFGSYIILFIQFLVLNLSINLFSTFLNCSRYVLCILLQNYKSESLLVHPPINLYSLLVNETLILQNMSQHNYENINILNDFINKVKIVHPELLKMTPNSSVMSFVRNRTDKFIANTKKNMMDAQRRRENERLNKSIVQTLTKEVWDV